MGNHEFDEGAAESLRIQNGGCHPVDGCANGTPYKGAEFQYLSANAFVTETRKPLHQGGQQTGPNACDINGRNGLTGPIVDIAAGMDPSIDVVISGHTHQAYNCELSGKFVTSASSR